jgi:hypothetical protein
LFLYSLSILIPGEQAPVRTAKHVCKHRGHGPKKNPRGIDQRLDL